PLCEDQSSPRRLSYFRIGASSGEKQRPLSLHPRALPPYFYAAGEYSRDYFFLRMTRAPIISNPVPRSKSDPGLGTLATGIKLKLFLSIKPQGVLTPPTRHCPNPGTMSQV